MTENSTNSQEHRLWLTHEWYIKVDDQGQCKSRCNEGALGFVIQLHSVADEMHHMALKLPRLLGDTRRENAYITQLMEQEARAVKNVFRAGRITDCLLEADTSLDVLRKDIDTIRGIPEAQKWHGALVLVRYKKGENPYFCLVKFGENDQCEFFPETITDKPPVDCGADPKKKIETAASKKVGDNSQLWTQAVILPSGQSILEKQNAILSLDTALDVAGEGIIWYTCLPSVIYRWANSTLQEAISRDKRGHWDIHKHLGLIYRICTGLKALHDRKMIHADVRPANIVYHGNDENAIIGTHGENQDAKAAKYIESYRLSDYGSFAQSIEPLWVSEQRNQTDQTVLGPVVGGERMSPFYSSERREGIEREDADTALIYSPGNGNNDFRFVVIGWRSDLIDEAGNPKDEVINDVKGNSFDKLGGQITLAKGDRIQLREYIFDVVEERRLDKRQYIKCKREFWTVFHGRIVIRSEEKLSEKHWFSIPRTIELLQWSAATDLYSLGALALYTVFHNVSNTEDEIPEKWPKEGEPPDQTPPERASPDEILSEEDPPDQFLFKGTTFGQSHDERRITQNGPPEDVILAHSNLEGQNKFAQMLRYLSDPSHFNAIWPELEWLRHQLETNLHANLKAEDYAKLNYRPYIKSKKSKQSDKGLSGSDTENINDDSEEDNLKSATLKVVSRLSSTIPGIRRLVQAFDYKLGPFIFYLHFALRCMHRANTMLPEFKKSNYTEWMKQPFCKNRLESPSDGAVNDAREQLEHIMDLLHNDRLNAIDCEPNVIPVFDPRPHYIIQRNIEVLEAQVDNLEVDKKRLEANMEEQKVKNQAELDQIEVKHQAELDQIKNILKEQKIKNQSELDQIIKILDQPWFKLLAGDQCKKILVHLESLGL